MKILIRKKDLTNGKPFSIIMRLLLTQGGNHAMKMTFQPKKRDRKVHGFRARMASAGGRKVLKARRAKGRRSIA